MTHLNLPFGEKGWQLDRIPDIKGKTYVITGANSGIGFEAAKVFAERGAEVIMLCRNTEKAEKAIQEIKKHAGPDAKISNYQLDLASIESITRTAKQIAQTYPRIDALINNAGLMMLPKRTLTKDGFETQMGVNHFGHFVLNALLLENVENANGRIVSVSSDAHGWGMKKMKLHDLNLEKGYLPIKAYAHSKLANLLYIKELDRRLKAKGSKASAYVCHPGYTDTNLKHTGPGFLYRQIIKIQDFLLRPHSAAHGAKSILIAATDPEAKPATFYGTWKNGTKPVPFGISETIPEVDNREVATKLWELSEDLTGFYW